MALPFSFATSRATLVIGMLVAASFLLSHPYGGIRHDGILYLGEALLRLDPARMADDLFFLYGSQGSFTVLPYLYAKAIERLGIGDGTRLLMAATFAAYFCSTFWLLRRLVPAGLLGWSMLVLFVGAPVYGGHQVFAYVEPFFTARSVAEPLVLFGLGWLVRGRPIAAVACMVAALAMHPLIAIPGLLAVWAWLVLRDRRWAWLCLLSVVPAAAGAFGIAPFDGLYRRFDPSWMAVVQEANPIVFVLNWSTSDWALVVFDLTVVGWLAKRSPPAAEPLERFAAAVLLGGIVGIATASIGADLLSNVLLTGLQLWRSHWLLHYFAMAMLPFLLTRLWRREEPNDRAAALLLVAAALSLTTFGPMVLAPAAAALVAFRRRVPVTRDLLKALGLFCIALALVLVTRQLTVLAAFVHQLEGSLPVRISRFLSITLLLMITIGAGLHYLPKRPNFGLVAAGLLLLTAAFGWDQRETWTLYQEDFASHHPLLWEDTVGATDRVYWFREVRAPWLMMRHANYYSPNQAGGVLFNRKTALEIGNRGQITAMLEFQETICRTMNNLNRTERSCEPDIEVVRDICTSADRLSFIVLQSALPMHPAGVLRTGFIEHDYEKTFYLYRCADLSVR